MARILASHAVHEFLESNLNLKVVTSFGELIKPGAICVLDASFNPPHNAHLQILKSAINHFSGSNSLVLLLLSTNNADKSPKPASFDMRLDMMSIFAKDLVSHSDPPAGVAIALTRHARFLDKLQAINSDFLVPRNLAGSNVVFLVGFDTLIRIFDQKYYPEPLSIALDYFMNNCSLLCLDRRPDDISVTPIKQDQNLDQFVDAIRLGKLPNIPRSWAENVIKVPAPASGATDGVSSSAIREAAKTGDSALLDRMLIKGVKEYILDNELYLE